MDLKVSGLNFSYNGHVVLQGIEFALRRGEILGVLGINGAGKTTLLKCLNRILHPQGGSIFLDEHDVRRMSRSQIAANFAYVSKNTGKKP
jgi:iron complex transport system ATP-binding protein